MKLQIATIFISLCGAVLAAPAHSPRNEKRIFPFPFPGAGEGSEADPEPTMPIPSYPFQSESGGLVQSTGLPQYGQFGGGKRCGESPLSGLSGLGEELPWGQLGADEEGSESDLMAMEDDQGIMDSEDEDAES
ncbi:hypothetical protein BDW62DRAFT_30138 [Aspergillus aurantiobrunneus]